MTRDRYLERRRKKQGRGNNSCHFFDYYFLSCFVFSATLFQNINIRLLIRETLSGQFNRGKLSKSECLIIVIVIFFVFFSLNTKRTQTNFEKTSI